MKVKGGAQAEERPRCTKKIWAIQCVGEGGEFRRTLPCPPTIVTFLPILQQNCYDNKTDKLRRGQWFVVGLARD